MIIEYRRIYDHDLDTELKDAYTIYIDRIYPRGLSRDNKKIKHWVKNVAPEMELIKWFHQNSDQRWPEFKKKYYSSLMSRYKSDSEFRNEIDSLVRKGKSKGHLLILYSSKDVRHNNARVFAKFIKTVSSK